MAGTITTGNIPRLTQEGIKSVFGKKYNEHSPEWGKIFTTHSSSKSFELDVQLEGFGAAVVKDEGADIAFDSQRQGFTPKYQHITSALGYIITQEALEDNLYTDQSKKGAKALAYSIRQAKETTGANVLNNAFDATVLMIDGDGKSLLATDHSRGPSGGTFSNKLAVAADLSETSLEDMLILIGQATDARGLKIALQAQRLIVPIQLAFEAQRILGSVLQNDTGNNATNAIRDMNAIREGHSVNHYLTDADAWFITTNAPDGLKHFNRMAVDFGQDNSFNTGNARFKARERYSFGWTDPRGCYGSEGAA